MTFGRKFMLRWRKIEYLDFARIFLIKLTIEEEGEKALPPSPFSLVTFLRLDF